MEERHSLSEPRICPTATEHNLAWELDVYRENVKDPIETLRIDDESLPPRLRRGKVVWRLPTVPGKLPSFGTDERRRIMELFKEKKKNRRKKKQDKVLQKKSSTVSEISVESSEPKDTGASKTTPQKEDTKGSYVKGGGTSQILPGFDSVKEKKKNKASKKGKANNDSFEKDRKDLSNKGPKIKESPPPIDKAQYQPPESKKDPNPQTSSNSTESDVPPGITTQSSQNKTTSRRSIHVPHSSDPLVKPTTAAAKSLISLYYPSITHGLSNDLCCYFNEKSQKSISVGGAHSVVTGLEGITMQITSLAGCQFSVRGVVAQDTADGGAHLLITGVCTPKGGFVTAFAHSIGLERVKDLDDDIGVNGNSSNSGHNFMIQNDALSLLNGEMAMAAEQQQMELQRKQQMHHHDVMMEEKSNQHLYARNEQGPSLLKPPGLFE